MSAPLRVGLVGYGFGGRYFHAPLVSSAPNCDFVGMVTTSRQRRQELAAEHPGVTAYDTLADLVAAGAEAVAISTPALTHVPLTNEAAAVQGTGPVPVDPWDAVGALTVLDAARVSAL